MEARSGSGQTVSADRQYDAFGLVMNSSGTWNQFGYAGSFGYQEDADHGLKLLGHRYYDPSTGRFLTRDPIKSGRNWYRYCKNNPLLFMDPSGLTCWWASVGYGGIIPFGSASVGLSVGRDIDTGHWGIQVTGGAGVGMGMSWGPGVGAEYDTSDSISGNAGGGGTFGTEQVIGFTALAAQGELIVNNSAINGGSVQVPPEVFGMRNGKGNVSGGVGDEHGEGAGVYWEHRIEWTIDVTEGVQTIWEATQGGFFEIEKIIQGDVVGHF